MSGTLDRTPVRIKHHEHPCRRAAAGRILVRRTRRGRRAPRALVRRSRLAFALSTLLLLAVGMALSIGGCGYAFSRTVEDISIDLDGFGDIGCFGIGTPSVLDAAAVGRPAVWMRRLPADPSAPPVVWRTTCSCASRTDR